MTKDEAAAVITHALVASGPQENILGADAFAERIATALDAIGLLAYAATQQQLAELNRIIDPASGAKAPSTNPIAAALGQSPAEGGAPEYWAGKRQRT